MNHVLAFFLLPFAFGLGLSAQSLTPEQQAAFLRTGKVIASRQTEKGVTQPFRLTLTDGTVTHDAHFQSVDERRSISNTGRGRRPELHFADSWRYNIAAHRVASLLGLGDMVPVSVERAWNGRLGAITWWVDDVLMDDEGRRKSGAQPPDVQDHNAQSMRMRVFTQLVFDTDRNQGNILWTNGWRLVMVDFTRAFRPWKKLPDPIDILRRCDRALLAALRGLTKGTVQKAAGDSLTGSEIDALLARRDIIVKHFDGLVARLGEENVLY